MGSGANLFQKSGKKNAPNFSGRFYYKFKFSTNAPPANLYQYQFQHLMEQSL